MKIKTKLLLSICGSIILLLFLAFDILILLTSDQITTKLNSELTNQADNITKQVSDLITTSARTYLTAVGEQSNSIVNEYYKSYEMGKISLKEAYDLALKSIINFKIIDTGTVFITDDMGIIISHSNKKMINTIAPMQAWIQRLIPNENNFKFYEYQGSNKLVYSIYNRQFNYNICISASTSEFINFVDMKELNKTINNIKIGKTGYPFLLSKDGFYVTNPDKYLIKTNVLNVKDKNGTYIYESVIHDKNGYFEFNLKSHNNKTEQHFLVFKKVPDSDLILCLTGKVGEFYDVIISIKRSIFVLGIIILIILYILVFIVSSTVTLPIISLTKNLDDVVHGNGDLTKRISVTSSDEIGFMVNLFNTFLNTLQTIIIDIKKSVSITLNTKDRIIFSINEITATSKKILANIVSIKNQTKQLASRNINMVLHTNEIGQSITELDLSLESISDITKYNNDLITEMIPYCRDIQSLVKELVTKSNNYTKSTTDDEIKKMFEDITILTKNIGSKNKDLYGLHQNLFKKISVLTNINKLVESHSSSIKKGTSYIVSDTLETKQMTSYILSSMDHIIHSTEKINFSMNKLEESSTKLELTGDNLTSSINRFKT